MYLLYLKTFTNTVAAASDVVVINNCVKYCVPYNKEMFYNICASL